MELTTLILVINIILMLAIVLLMIIYRKELREKTLLKIKLDEANEELRHHHVAIRNKEVYMSSTKLEVTNELLSTLEKIKKNYQICKKDKITLLKYTNIILREYNLYDLNEIKSLKDITYKEACNNIVKYVKAQDNVNRTKRIEILNYIYYLLNK